MKIFISGASGLLGGNCQVHFESKGWDVVGTHLSFPTENTVFFDTLNHQHPDSFDFLGFKPDVVVHCGALTHVDYCESHQAESYEKTVLSTERLLDLTRQCNAKFVFISTDYLFDGSAGPYLETQKANPINIYGVHKALAEELVKKYEDHLILRITNVYGDEIRNKNFVSRIVEQCKAGQELMLKLPYDQFASPTSAHDIARAMFLLVRDGKRGLYHIAGSDFMNRVTLALRVLSYFPEAKYQLQALSTIEMNQPAQRPLLGGLLPVKFLSEYPDFLFGTVDSYLSDIVR